MIIETHAALPEPTTWAWDDFMRQARHAHPRQTRAAAGILTALGHDVLHVIGRRDDAICAAGLFSLQRSRLVPGRYARADAASGPVCDDAATLVEFLGALPGSAAFARVDAIVVTPYWLEADAADLAAALQAAGWSPSEPGAFRSTGLIDLTPSEDALRASFSRSARRKVRLVEQQDIVIRKVHDPAEARTFFERLDRFVIERHGLTPISEPERDAIIANVCGDPSFGAIIAAFDDDVFLGGMLVYRSRRTAHGARYVADLDHAKKLRVASAIWLQGMFWAKRQGCTVLDVEGYEDIADRSHPRFNVYEYKRELGPRAVRRIGEHTLLLNASAHKLDQISGRIGALVRRRLAGSVTGSGAP